MAITRVETLCYVVNLIYASEGDGVGHELSTNPSVRKISFAGSTEVGRLLMRQCADQISRRSASSQLASEAT
ncbi:aldehyde dehydrogenase family protein (plasmid) [Mesorhizobium sp. AR02]|nr:aldehyde dehydrogenase family protein [Mesorhizobium sp. AR02]